MDNNFNMNAPVHHTYQVMPVEHKKKRTGLIIGIISGVAALAVIAVILIFVLGGSDDDLVGTWTLTADGSTLTYIFNDDNSGSMGADPLVFPMTWERDGDNLTLTISLMGESSSNTVTIKELTSDKLVLSGDGQTMELTRAD